MTTNTMHDRVQTELLSLYVWGALDAGNREVVEEHLATCAVCEQECQREESVRADLLLAEDEVHQRVQTELLSLYVWGALDVANREVVEEHLDTCAVCEQECQREESVRADLLLTEEEPAAEGVQVHTPHADSDTPKRRPAQRAPASQTRRRAAWRWGLAVVPASAVAAMLAVVYLAPAPTRAPLAPYASSTETVVEFKAERPTLEESGLRSLDQIRTRLVERPRARIEVMAGLTKWDRGLSREERMALVNDRIAAMQAALPAGVTIVPPQDVDSGFGDGVVIRMVEP